MLLKRATLSGIVDGSITLQFRRWERPTVRTGGTLLTSVGQLAIEAVELVDVEAITAAEARAAGFADRGALMAMLESHATGDAYRVRLSLLRPNPRAELRGRIPSDEEVDELRGRLDRIDARSRLGPWTRSTLRAIRAQPGVRAATLAAGLDRARADFKAGVRKLKALGLTESLEVGYRLSPRGEHFLGAVDEDDPPDRSD